MALVSAETKRPVGIFTALGYKTTVVRRRQFASDMVGDRIYDSPPKTVSVASQLGVASALNH